MTLHAYQTLYESSIAFGIRKALQAEQGKTDMEGAIARLEEDKAALEKGGQCCQILCCISETPPLVPVQYA